ncbi:MAG: SulP family inorganic anion transporter [Armatimonadota bacterium]
MNLSAQLSNLRRDLPASLVVFLIAIPLSLGIAMASGAPVMAGLIAAAVGGIVVGLCGGSALQVSGPAAGLTVLVFTQVQQLGWPVVCAVTALAGVFQIVLGGLRVARGALAIAPAVVHGMLAGIGVVIALAQVHVVLGGKPQASALLNLKELPGQIADLHGVATFLGLLTIALLIGWKYVPKPVGSVPAPLVAVVFATVVSVVGGWEVPRVDLPDNLYGSHVFPALPKDWVAFLTSAGTIALIASVESLLSAVAVDRMHEGERANLDRELVGQGAGNLVSGLLGGLPVTGVIVRSSANVAAGAASRFSAVLHGIWVLIFVAALGSLIEKIPLSVLAGLLVHVGVNLIKPAHIRELRDHREAPIYFATIAGVAGMNLLAGVGIGIGLSLLTTLRRLATTRIQHSERDGRHLLKIEGTLTFASVPSLNKALATLPSGSEVDIDLSVDFLDHAAFESLHNWKVQHVRRGGKVDIDERHEDWFARAEEGKPRDLKSTPIGAISSFLFGRRGGKSRTGDLLSGIREYESTTADRVRPLMSRLAVDGQAPKELFITCCDSRVVPHQFTASGPGDLFKLRNIGNIVPPSGAENSVGAAIEYAVGVLGVKTIVVCGHSRCGAMNALLTEPDLSGAPHLSIWLQHARTSLARFRAGVSMEDALPAADQLALINVAEQMANLRTHAIVRDREADGSLKLLGLFIDLEEARVFVYDESDQRFRRVPTDQVPLPVEPLA